jgi:hypothetical protein
MPVQFVFIDICGNGENGEFRVVCGTQKCLQIRGNNLCVHGEVAKRHKIEDISVNNGPT